MNTLTKDVAYAAVMRTVRSSDPAVRSTIDELFFRRVDKLPNPSLREHKDGWWHIRWNRDGINGQRNGFSSENDALRALLFRQRFGVWIDDYIRANPASALAVGIIADELTQSVGAELPAYRRTSHQ